MKDRDRCRPTPTEATPVAPTDRDREGCPLGTRGRDVQMGEAVPCECARMTRCWRRKARRPKARKRRSSQRIIQVASFSQRKRNCTARVVEMCVDELSCPSRAKLPVNRTKTGAHRGGSAGAGGGKGPTSELTCFARPSSGHAGAVEKCRLRKRHWRERW